MKAISLALPMLSPSSLIILFFSWLLWGCLFNLASARLGFHLAYLLGLSRLLSFMTLPLDGIMILGVPFGSTSFISSFLQKVLVEDV